MHSGLVFKCISEALSVGKGACLLHTRGLHNATENVVGMVADSMGRSRTKLTANEERHGTTRVGPSADVLQVTRSGTDIMGSGQEPPLDESRGFVMTDPNSSMWNIYKDNSENAEAAASKIKKRITKMKDDIKSYYVERLEENQVLFAELEEPFKIGKKNMGRKALRGEELEPESVVHAAHKPRKPIRQGSFLQMKQTENDVEALPEERPQKGYRRFTAASKSSKAEERTWKRSQGKQEANDAQEGLADVGGLSPVGGHFRSIMPPAYGLVDSVPLLFRKPGFGGCRNFSSLARHSDVLGAKSSVVVSSNAFQTSSNSQGCCLPNPCAPILCDPKYKLPKCPKPVIHCWPECEKITLCGCKPVHPRICCDCCICLHADYSYAKRPEYICPAFSECKRKCSMNKRPLNECCARRERPKPCEHFVQPYVPFVHAIERQEKVLGRPYWTCMQCTPCCACPCPCPCPCGPCSPCPPPCISCIRVCKFHTSAIRRGACQPEKEDECEKVKKLPCHKVPVYVPGDKKRETPQVCGKGQCEKLCMPCCEPARNPPECVSLFKKQPCRKFSNPRPSFSECKKKFPFKHIMCECEVAKKPLCPAKRVKRTC